MISFNTNDHLLLPFDSHVLANCTPIYEEVPGWQCQTFGMTEYAQLPELAKTYLHRLESLCEVPITVISTGPECNQTMILSSVFD